MITETHYRSNMQAPDEQPLTPQEQAEFDRLEKAFTPAIIPIRRYPDIAEKTKKVRPPLCFIAYFKFVF